MTDRKATVVAVLLVLILLMLAVTNINILRLRATVETIAAPYESEP